ncbi:hypothetical protein H6G81_34805 [Scytonema hofmannii FACHB-248]|uniref:Uncharacterized protein n=1 Tax=Scytonema hofmannii FACHB-248 TaxID=1842502 RepID=A0ABR8H3A7_9CYAN|nr:MULTISPECIES: hypothetical protein [Nostocales]MBD2609523.1 hypothetical protein [Scytonema hofmannii FACHB-248]
MAKAVHLGAWFLTGCIASSFIAWLGALHPALFRVMWVVYIVAAVALVLALFTDDAVRPFFKLSEPDYYALLIGILGALVLGGVLSWLLGG